MTHFLLVIDEGTTSTRAMAFDRNFQPVALAQAAIGRKTPQDGWVEQDGVEIWEATRGVCLDAIRQAGGVDAFAGVAITNQRETTLVWERSSGQPIAPAIVWQDRRTASVCERLRGHGHEPRVSALTGLLLDPYFSATKIAWILDSVGDARERAQRGELAFGTVDSFLIDRLSGGKAHVTDVTNASRTLLMDLQGSWSDELCALFGVPRVMLPEICPSSGVLGQTEASLFGRPLPILAAIGDQQAALVGQGCLEPGRAKITYGTGAFLVAHAGARRPQSRHRLLATAAYQIGEERAFALEGAIFNAGTVVKWLRDSLGLIADAGASGAMAAALPDNGGVWLVPAFTGLGAPHWDADARGLICGLTLGTTREHLVRAGLEATAYQTRELLDAFVADGVEIAELRVDGGMVANEWLMQFLADICARPVRRPDVQEMTALGAAALAGMALGWTDRAAWAQRPVPGRTFTPAMTDTDRDRLMAGWRGAMSRTLTMG